MTQFDSGEESKRESIKSGDNVKEKTEVGDSILENVSREKEVDLDLENSSNNGKPIINKDVDKAMEIAVEIDSISLNEKQDKKLYCRTRHTFFTDG